MNTFLFFSITKLATNKIIVLLPITQITFISSSLVPQTYAVDCNDTTQARHCSGFVMVGRERDSVSKLVNPHNSYSRICALLLPDESNVARQRQVSRGIDYVAIFKTGGNFKSNTGHFYINFEYKTHLNFGSNFSKKKVHHEVRKIQYVFYLKIIFIAFHLQY